MILVRAVAASDRAEWHDMWDAYCAFYGAVVPPNATACTWGRVVAGEGAVRGLIACDAVTNRVLGFANYVVHPYTWSENPACYLEDLFVRAESRGRGAGGALIERLLTLAREHRWSRVYWMTQQHNDVARRLYDRIGARDDFVRYVVPLDGS